MARLSGSGLADLLTTESSHPTLSPIISTVDYDDRNTPIAFDDLPVQVPLSSWSVPVNGYISPVLILFTLVTNSFVCAVLLRPGMRTPTNVLLVAMAVSDTLTGLSPLPSYLYFYTFGNHVEWVPYSWCYVYFCLSEHLPTVFHTASVWLTVALGVHRYICVCRSPETRRRTSTTGSAVSIIVIIYGITIVSQACRFFESTYDPVLVPSLMSSWSPEANASTNEQTAGQRRNETELVVACKTHFVSWVDSNEHVYFNVYYWFRVVFIHLVPCSTLVTVNAALVRAMRTATRRRKQLLSSGSASQQPTHQRRKSECRRLADSNVTTAMLIAVVGVFLLVEFPLAVLFILVIIENSFHIQLIDSEVGEIASMFINLMILFSYSTNFFIYCSMSTQFRTTLISMLTGRGSTGRRGVANRGERTTREQTTFVDGLAAVGQSTARKTTVVGSTTAKLRATYIAMTADNVDGNGSDLSRHQGHSCTNGIMSSGTVCGDVHEVEKSGEFLTTNETYI